MTYYSTGNVTFTWDIIKGSGTLHLGKNLVADGVIDMETSVSSSNLLVEMLLYEVSE